MMLTKEEIFKIDKHLYEQRRIRKISKESFQDREFLDSVLEQIFFHSLDFIYENEFYKDKKKLAEVLDYIKNNQI